MYEIYTTSKPLYTDVPSYVKGSYPIPRRTWTVENILTYSDVTGQNGSVPTYFGPHSTDKLFSDPTYKVNGNVLRLNLDKGDI